MSSRQDEVKNHTDDRVGFARAGICFDDVKPGFKIGFF
jgi:hypothetical protein